MVVLVLKTNHATVTTETGIKGRKKVRQKFMQPLDLTSLSINRHAMLRRKMPYIFGRRRACLAIILLSHVVVLYQMASILPTKVTVGSHKQKHL